MNLEQLLDNPYVEEVHCIFHLTVVRFCISVLVNFAFTLLVKFTILDKLYDEEVDKSEVDAVAIITVNVHPHQSRFISQKTLYASFHHTQSGSILYTQSGKQA
ncbi:MAG: hypothetical protein ACOZBL_00070 [Patescibacteria group bacterium]